MDVAVSDGDAMSVCVCVAFRLQTSVVPLLNHDDVLRFPALLAHTGWPWMDGRLSARRLEVGKYDCS